MLEILTRAGCFVFIIALGFFLKKIGVFKESDFSVLSKIVIRITLPAAIITNFSGQQIDPAMLTLALVGLGGGLVYILAALVTGRRCQRERRAFDVLNLPGYNIGNFTMPFVQSFLGAPGVITTSLFDVGNSLVCLGGALGVASMIQSGQRFSVRRLLRTMSRSVPLLTYITMAVLTLLRISLPAPVVSCAQIIGSANAFLAMLMLGVGFRFSAEPKHLGTMARILLLRYGIAAALALGCYFLLPFGQEVRRTLVILLFSPIGSAVPAFTGEIGGDTGLSSAINSMSILISIVIIVTLLTVML